MSLEVPETRYALRPDGVSIAYQIVGDGPTDLVYVPGFISHLELMWADPGFTRFMERLSSFTRVLFFDKPGTGLSDPLPHVPTVEERADDIRCVLAAAGFERAVVMGFSEGAAASAYFAATAPELVERLVLYGAVTRLAPPDEDEASEMGIDSELYHARLPKWLSDLEFLRSLPDHWGDGRILRLFAPSIEDNAVQRRVFGVLERSSASPGMARALVDAALLTDVSDVLASITAPCLVLHRVGDVVPIELGRHLARQIPGAELVELDGADHAFWVGDSTEALDAIEEFVTGAAPTSQVERTLVTVLFTDIVGSTELAAEQGDAAWSQLLQRHDDAVAEEVRRLGGRVVKSMGDGVLALFTGPARAVAAGEAIRSATGDLGLRIRIGIHTGECEVRPDDLSGIGVHIAARVMAEADPDEVLVSSTVRDLVVGSGLQFSDRGEHDLKGVPGTWHLFAAGEHRERETPLDGPREHMRLTDRAAVQLARRVPRATRLATRLIRSG